MGKCVNHEDKETSYVCMKHNIYLCEECIKCRDPELYCKHRSSCPIHFMTKKGTKDWIEKRTGAAIEKPHRFLIEMLLWRGYDTPNSFNFSSCGTPLSSHPISE